MCHNFGVQRVRNLKIEFPADSKSSRGLSMVSVVKCDFSSGYACNGVEETLILEPIGGQTPPAFNLLTVKQPPRTKDTDSKP